MTPSLLRLLFAAALILGLVWPGLAGEANAGPKAPVDKVDPALRKQLSAYPYKKLPVIVEMIASPSDGKDNKQRAKEAYDLLQKLNKDGDPVGELPVINAAVGFANAKGVETLTRQTKVSYVYEDSLIYPRQTESGVGSTRPPGQLSAPYPRLIGADKVWLAGPTGKGVTVAVLDSGIYSHPDLTLPQNRIVARANFADSLAAGSFDPGGHGTHVAGIIAGNGSGADLSRRTAPVRMDGPASLVEYVGVAPGANLVDVRVLNEQGYGRVSSAVAGIQWVLRYKDQYNIKVINLSIGAPAPSSYRLDPLSAAAEIAWLQGVVVVAASGNGGTYSVERPGIDPYVITVGALDDQGTLPVTDDVVAAFSARGPIVDTYFEPDLRYFKPDLVAPGRRIVSLRAEGSYLDQLYPDRVVTAKSGADYFRLTGTSMATAVVSGTVALMLEQNPGLRPDQVKAILVGTTQVYGQDNKATAPELTVQGAGLVNAHAAVFSPALPLANRGLRPADPTARAVYGMLYTGVTWGDLSWIDPTYAGVDWSNLAWDNLAWDNLAWDNLAWDNLAWDNLAWDNLAWDNLAWDNLAWDNLAWDNLAWDNLALD